MSATKLNEEKVREMRELRALGASRMDLADKYDVAVETVASALTGVAWSRAGGPLDKTKGRMPLGARDVTLQAAWKALAREYCRPVAEIRRWLELMADRPEGFMPEEDDGTEDDGTELDVGELERRVSLSSRSS